MLFLVHGELRNENLGLTVEMGIILFSSVGTIQYNPLHGSPFQHRVFGK